MKQHKEATLHSINQPDENNEFEINTSYTSYDNIETNKNPLTGP
jgi:hypothetical protein